MDSENGLRLGMAYSTPDEALAKSMTDIDFELYHHLRCGVVEKFLFLVKKTVLRC